MQVLRLGYTGQELDLNRQPHPWQDFRVLVELLVEKINIDSHLVSVCPHLGIRLSNRRGHIRSQAGDFGVLGLDDGVLRSNLVLEDVPQPDAVPDDEHSDGGVEQDAGNLEGAHCVRLGGADHAEGGQSVRY